MSLPHFGNLDISTSAIPKSNMKSRSHSDSLIMEYHRVPLQLAAFAVIILLSVGSLYYLHARRSEHSTTNQSNIEGNYFRDTSTECAIDGNGDHDGIGVRVGIYLQVWSSSFIPAFETNAASDNLPTIIWFQIALFVATVYVSAMKSIYASEALIAILLLAILQLYNFLLISSLFVHLAFRRIRQSHTRPMQTEAVRTEIMPTHELM